MIFIYGFHPPPPGYRLPLILKGLFAYFCSLIPLQKKGYAWLQSGLNFAQWQKLVCINCEVLVYILKLIAGGYLFS